MTRSHNLSAYEVKYINIDQYASNTQQVLQEWNYQILPKLRSLLIPREVQLTGFSEAFKMLAVTQLALSEDTQSKAKDKITSGIESAKVQFV